MSREKRNCGMCRECCIVLDVDALQKPENRPCEHLCGGGCAIYDRRPDSCRAFTCAWREGMMSVLHRPNATHMIVWATTMTSRNGEQVSVIQCNIRSGFSAHKKTLLWLFTVASYNYPTLIVQDRVCQLVVDGKALGSWHQDDFVRFTYEGDKIVGVESVKRSEVLRTEQDEKDWLEVKRNTMAVVETDPTYARAQQQFAEGRS